VLDEESFAKHTSGQAAERVLSTSFRVNYVRKDKTPIPVAVTLSTIVAKGSFDGTVAILRDITKEKEIDKVKTEFVSLASHQLRTPLSAVNWYAEMLLDGDAGALNEKQRKYVEQMYHGNQRMVELVNALLNVSRLELGTFAVEPKPTEVVKLALATVEEMRFLIDQRRITFEERHDEGIPLLDADPNLLGMILQNLLSNAVKYTPLDGTIKLDIGLIKKGTPVEGRQVKEDSIGVVVSDNGYGIPKAQQDKIFTKLFRADNVRQKDTEGTGLGLYIVKSIVDQAGGDLWFTSEENKGTTFHVILPTRGMAKKIGTKKLESEPNKS
jgi:signal transduction histidine kinase